MNFEKIKNNLVVSSNDLVHAKYDLSLWQKRVFVYAISQLEKDSKDFEPIKMNIADIIKFYKGSDGAKTYNAIIEAPKSLDRTLEIPYVSKEGGLRYGFVKLLQNYTLPADSQAINQYIEVCFNNDLRPHLLELKEKFLKYDIRNVIDLQSTYSFRVFEILKSYEYKKEVEFDIDYLREVLEVKNIYKSYKDFKRRIIDKAQEDLLKYCDISFVYREKKASKGKKIEALIFTIQKNQSSKRENEPIPQKAGKKQRIEQGLDLFSQPKTPQEVPKETPQDKIFLDFSPIVISDFGVTPTVFLKLLEKHTEGDVLQAIEVTKQEKAKGKIQNIAGFFVEALKNSYQSPKEIVKKKEVEKKAKQEAEKTAEQEEQNRVGEAKRKEAKRRIEIIKRLISEQAPIINEALEEIKKGMFRNSYNSQKSVEENLSSPMFAGGIINALEKLDTYIFK